jgi:hypothetical protein
MTDDDYKEFLMSKRVRIANRFKDLKITKLAEEKIEYEIQGLFKLILIVPEE